MLSQFVVGFVVIDPVILVKFTFHPLSLVLSATLNMETGVICSNIWLSTFVTFSIMDLETPAWNKRKSEVRWWPRKGRDVGQCDMRWQREAANEKCSGDWSRCLATLSLVNAAEPRELTATVFKTYLVPCAEPVAEAMAEAGRFHHEAAGAIKDRQEAERAEAHEQLGPPFVHVSVA